jgi:hypothetical protein
MTTKNGLPEAFKEEHSDIMASIAKTTKRSKKTGELEPLRDHPRWLMQTPAGKVFLLFSPEVHASEFSKERIRPLVDYWADHLPISKIPSSSRWEEPQIRQPDWTTNPHYLLCGSVKSK